MLLSAWAHTRFDLHYWWLPAAVAGVLVSLLLMFRASKAGYALALIICVGIAIAVLPHVCGAESYLADGWSGLPSSALWRAAPHNALPVAVLSVLTAVISLRMLLVRRRG